MMQPISLPKDIKVDEEPSAILAEQAVLGVLLTRSEMVDTVSPVLKPHDFYAEPHKILYATMLDMRAGGELVDIISVQDRLGRASRLDRVGGPIYLGELVAAAPSGKNIEAHIGIIRDRSKRRQLRKVADGIKESAVTAADLSQGTAMSIEELFRLLREGGVHHEPMPIGKLLPGVIDQIDQRGKGVFNGIKTGFDDLDAKLLGGFRFGDLVVVAGRPSMGKTTFSMQIAANVAIDQKPVMVFTLEMSKDQICERAVAQVGGIEFSRIISGALQDDDYDRLSYAMTKLNGAPMHIDDTGGLTVQDIAARARAQAKIGGLSMIVVDYLQYMGYTGRASSRNDQLGEISRMLKSLAKELNVVCVLLSQLNRGVESRADKRPIMSDLRESGAIEQDADLIIMLYRDEFYYPDTEFKGIAEVLIRKARNGETGKVNLHFEGNKVRFGNLGPGYY